MCQISLKMIHLYTLNYNIFCENITKLFRRYSSERTSSFISDNFYCILNYTLYIFPTKTTLQNEQSPQWNTYLKNSKMAIFFLTKTYLMKKKFSTQCQIQNRKNKKKWERASQLNKSPLLKRLYRTNPLTQIIFSNPLHNRRNPIGGWYLFIYYQLKWRRYKNVTVTPDIINIHGYMISG